MLKSLTIKNYAIIEHICLEPGFGLNVLTGETGAGKSILLGALGLVLGHRADLSVLREPDQKCVVEGIFEIGRYNLRKFFNENDLDYSETLIVRREILPAGKSRAFVNDTPARLDVLQKLSSNLIDLHQQFESLEIYQKNHQLSLIDAMADASGLKKSYANHYTTWQQTKNRLEQLLKVEAEASKELDFIKFQFDEIKELNPLPGEMEEMEEQLKTLENFEGIKLALSKVEAVIENTPASVEQQIKDLVRELTPLAEYSKEASDFKGRLTSAMVELNEISREAAQVNDRLEYNPEELEILQNRLDELNRLLKKHRLDSESEMIELAINLEKKIQLFSSVANEIEVVRKEAMDSYEKLVQEGEKLTAARKKAAAKLEQETIKILANLSMSNARLKVEFQQSNEPQSDGLDLICFMFSANKGMAYKDLKDVASGGEISRLNLALKSLIAGKMQLPTLVFDEIDSGVSGDVALKMGRILHQTAQSHQLIVITHSPQVAACGNTHFFIHKSSEGNRTNTKIRELKGQDRMHHLAVMLSSDPPGKAAMENALELLKINK